MEKKNEVMYRNEEAFGSGVLKTKDVIVYEICELCNTDIIDYCLDTYGDFLSEDLKTKIVQLLDSMENEEEFDEDDIEELVEELIDELSEHFERNINYVIWLASKKAVIELYSDGNEDAEISAYKTSDIILSDLGYDGMLFGYDKKPRPIEED